MKKLLLLTSVIPFLSTSVAFAQPEKGSILLGAGIGMGVSPDVGLPRNQIIPKAAYFFTDNFAVGGLLKLRRYIIIEPTANSVVQIFIAVTVI